MAPDASAVAVVGTSALVGPDAPRPEIPLNPDGTLPDRQDSLYLVDLATGQPRVLVQGTPDAWVGKVSWTDDGLTLVYTVITRTGERFATTVWRRSATDPEAEPTRLYIYPDDSGVSVLEPAADGSAVTARGLAADGLNTTRIPLDSGAAAPVVGADPLFTFGHLRRLAAGRAGSVAGRRQGRGSGGSPGWLGPDSRDTRGASGVSQRLS